MLASGNNNVHESKEVATSRENVQFQTAAVSGRKLTGIRDEDGERKLVRLLGVEMRLEFMYR